MHKLILKMEDLKKLITSKRAKRTVPLKKWKQTSGARYTPIPFMNYQNIPIVLLYVVKLDVEKQSLFLIY